MLDDLRFRLRALFRRDDVEDDLDDELRFHLERAAEQQLARGLSPREAYRQAQLAFGPIDFVKEDCRRSWGIRQLDALRQDGTFALRLMRKHPALSAISAISLAIGIGLNTTLFALLDATLLRRLPIDRPERLVDVYTSEVDGFAWYGSSYPDYLDLRRGVRALSGLVGYVPAMGAVRTGDRSRAMPVEAVTGNYFQALGVPAAHGRVLLPEDDRPGAPPVVVVSSAFWSAAFDRDPGAIGRSLRIGGRRYTIVGVAPEGFAGMTAPILTPAFWTPMAWIDDVQPAVLHTGSSAPDVPVLENRGRRWMLLKGRLREGETTATAAADLNRVMQALASTYPDSNEGFRVTLVPTRDVATHPIFEDPEVVFYEGLALRDHVASQLLPARLLAAILGAAGLVAVWLAAVGLYGVIACEIVQRTREIGIRMALGATHRDVLGFVVRQCAVVVGIGAVLGSVSAFVAARATARVLFFGIAAGDAPAWGGAIVVSIAVGVVAHLVPALRAVGVAPSVALRSE